MNRDDYKSAESLNKNYLRTELKNNENKLLIISGKFKKVGKYYVTFSCIRPYIKGFRTKTLCDHLNIKKKDVENVIDLNELKFNRKYYMIGSAVKYNSRSDRYGFQLATDLNYLPLFICDKINKNWKRLYNMCSELDLDKYRRK